MPTSDSREDQRHERVYTVLFWVGVALAPFAALMMFFSSGTGGLKTALAFVIISVILIGVSIAMRREADGVRGELEETVYDEIDALRADVRADINQAAQATHRALGEKLQYLLDQIETTRAELAATRVQVDAMRHGISQPIPAQRHSAPAAVPQATGRAGIPPGVVRTETVHVTTRHTIMDPRDDGQRGNTYSSHSAPSRRGDEAWAPPEPRLREDPWAEPPRAREESWTEQRLREQYDRARQEPDERWRSPDSRQSKQDDDREFARERDRDRDRWAEVRPPDMRAGDRWASVRTDEHGRELRMGERRAAVHSDSSGTELRIEDRWAAVRREAGMSGGGWRFDDDQRLDAPRDFPYRDHREDDRAFREGDRGFREGDRGFREGDRGFRDDDRRAITGSDREERWSDYQQEYDRDRDRRYR